MKKITALLLIISIVMSLSVGVFADEHVYANHAAVKQAAESIEDGTEIEVDGVKYIAVKTYGTIAAAIKEDNKVNLYLIADIEWGNTIDLFTGSIYGGDKKITLDGTAMFLTLGNADGSSNLSNFTVGGSAANITEGGVLCKVIRGGTFTNITTDESLKIDVTADCVGGFFGLIANGFDSIKITMQNCINNATVDGNLKVGGFIGGISGAKNGTIEFVDCVNNAAVTGTQYVGGFIGGVTQSYKYTISFTNCVNNAAATSTGNFYAGGLVGGVHTAKDVTNITFTNCVNNGAISSTMSYAGGIIGGYNDNSGSSKHKVVIEGCVNNGSVTSTNTTVNASNPNGRFGVGGIMGCITAGFDGTLNIENCINSGAVSAKDVAGGIFGGVNGLVSSVNPEISIRNCVNTGMISAEKCCSAIANAQHPEYLAKFEVIGCMSTVAGLGFVYTTMQENYTFTNPDYAGFIQTKKDGENTLVRFIMVVSKEEMQTAEYTDFTMTVTVNGKTFTQKASELNSYDRVTAAGVEFAATDDFVLFGVVVDLGANALESTSVKIVDNTSATNVLYSGSYN